MKLIEKHYQHYLEKVKLKESEMSDVQKSETKRAFVAGMSELFVLMITGLGVNVTLYDYDQELKEFWMNEAIKPIKK